VVTAILGKYEKLRVKLGHADGTAILAEIAADCFEYLEKSASRQALKSLVSGKSYFAFRQDARMSRAVNSGLFIDDREALTNLLEKLRGNPGLDWLLADECNRFLYTMAITFCALSDVTSDNDQKTPGTFFEMFIGHLLSLTFGVKPRNQVEVLTVEDEKSTLPTDFIFDLGPSQLKFHVPVKTSTRERVVQVWAHQRMLNGVYGEGRFRGVLVAMAETKLDRRKLEVVEICLPDQWAVYQRFVARMHRVYYLDLPAKYAALAKQFPYIPVKTLGEFFKEKETLVKPESY
jgi:hypothetical protein